MSSKFIYTIQNSLQRASGLLSVHVTFIPRRVLMFNGDSLLFVQQATSEGVQFMHKTEEDADRGHFDRLYFKIK